MANVFLYEPFSDFERLLDAFSPRQGCFSGHSQKPQASGEGIVRLFKPRMDLHENTEKNVVTVTFELPGVVKDDVEISVENNRLTISAENKQSADFEEKGYVVRERRLGKLSRTLQLPQGVKSEELTASMENGVLTVTFPKSVPELAPEKVTIN